MSNSIEESFIELIDKHFPKGGKERGKAILFAAEALADIKRIIEEAKPVIENDDSGAIWATEEYHNNLLKVLGE